jgi:hypothetical protein
MVLYVLFLQQLEHRLEVRYLVGEPTNYDLCTTNLGDQVEEFECMVHEAGRSFPTPSLSGSPSKCKQLSDQ